MANVNRDLGIHNCGAFFAVEREIKLAGGSDTAAAAMALV